MSAILLFAGLLLLIYGVATLLGGDVAASRPLIKRSYRYAVVCAVGGAVLVVAGGVWLFRSL